MKNIYENPRTAKIIIQVPSPRLLLINVLSDKKNLFLSFSIIKKENKRIKHNNGIKIVS